MSDEPNISEGEELSYAEIYAAAALNGEIVITIPPEEVERVKTGLKNFKAKQAQKMKDDGLIPDPSTLTFTVRECLDEVDRESFIDLSIQLTRKSTIKVAKIRIPDQEM
jgi:hypothetical protein